MGEKNYTKRALSGFFVLFSGGILVSFVDYFIKFYLVRNLSVEAVGLFYSVLSFVLFFNLFKQLGFDVSIAKIVPEYIVKKQFRKVKTLFSQATIILFSTSAVLYLLLFAFRDVIVDQYFKNPEAMIVLTLLIIGHFLLTYQVPVMSIYRGYQKFSLTVYGNLFRSCFILLSIVFLIKYGVLAPAIAHIVAPILVGVFHWAWLKKHIFPSWKGLPFKVKDTKVAKHLFSYSVPSLMTSIGTKIVQHTDVMMLTYFTGLVSVAQYEVILPLASIALFISVALVNVLIPIVSEIYAKEDKKVVGQWINTIMFVALLAVIPILASIALQAEYVLRVLFSNDYVTITFELALILIAFFFRAIFDLATSVAVAIGRPVFVTKVTLAMVVFNVTTNFILIPRFGLLGAIITTLASLVIFSCISLFFVYGNLGVRNLLPKFILLIVPAAVYVGVFQFSSPNVASIISFGLLAFGAYLISIAALRIITFEQMKQLVGQVLHKKY